MYTMPEFRFTHAAKVAAAVHNEGEEQLVAAAKLGVIDLMGGKTPEEHTEDDDSLDNPLKIFFHCFDYHGRYNMIMLPSDDGVMLVDLAAEDRVDLTEGPLAGKSVLIPRSFSE